MSLATLLAEGPIDPDDPRFDDLLRNVQGNILKAHGRRHVRLLVLHFRGGAEENRRWVQDVAARHVTSARRQLDESEEFKRTGSDAGTVFGNFFLSAKGFEKLALTPGFEESSPDGVNTFFRLGMALSGPALHDPGQDAWDPAYRSQMTCDAMLLLASDDLEALEKRCREIVESLGVVCLLTVERGSVLKDCHRRNVEHFGYADGLSNPVFLTTDLDGAPSHWDPGAALGLALVPDPLVRERDCCGSFLVYRKLEQDVRGFEEYVDVLAREVEAASPELKRAYAGALLVGRFKDGTPLVEQGCPGRPGNDFVYRKAGKENDPDGLRCPLHAHIRKVNPRGESRQPQNGERGRRIVRRSIPYGGRAQGLTDRPNKRVGLLFLCFQSNIPRQFGFIQARWANAVDAPREGGGLDATISQPEDGQAPAAVTWPRAWGKEKTVEAAFRRFVTLKGGEFFFAPSLPFLRDPRPPEDQPPVPGA